jgi:nucleotide-binding universal stress UspA family protein
MKKILIALDFNPTAQKVAEVGYALAKSLGAEVILLHVIVDPLYYSTVENFPIVGYTGSIIAPLQIPNNEFIIKESKLFLNKIKIHLDDDNIQTLVKEGDSAGIILNTAKELKVDIIVMGSHSRRWLEDILLGSITSYVLNHSTIPLFIIPTQKSKNK